LLSTFQNDHEQEIMKHHEHKIVQAGDELFIDELHIDILHPFHFHEDENNQSIVMEIDDGNFKYLLLGDLYKELFYELPLSEVDVLKIGHHGSKTSTNSYLLEEVSPQIGIISSGKNNRYNHPHVETIEVLNRYQVKIFDTQTNNSIRISSFFNRLTITPLKK
jgi:competence protein ComEC